MKSARPGRLRVTFVHVETWWTPGMRRGSDPFATIRLQADLPLGLASVRAFAEADPVIAPRLESTNRDYSDPFVPREVAADILTTRPDIVALGCYLWNSAAVWRVCRSLKRLRPGVRIVVGGSEIPKAPDALRTFLAQLPFVDAAVAGEGEAVFAELLRGYLGTGELPSVPGTAVRAGRRIVVRLPGPDLLPLSRIPSPYLSGAVKAKPSKIGLVCLETSRGCPHACAYCDFHAGQRRLRFFPPARLKQELEALERGGFEGCLMLADPTVSAKQAHFLSVLRVLRNWKYSIRLEMRPEDLSEAAVRGMRALHRVMVAIGIQSTNPAALRNISRSFPRERSLAGIDRLLKDPGNIAPAIEIILGLPGDDYGSFCRTVDWALSFDPAPYLIFFDLIILPNTPLAAMQDRFSIRADPQGLVLSNATFSAGDLARASWLTAAYVYLASMPDKYAAFLRELRTSKRRPSSLLEDISRGLIAQGLLPRERVIGQGGRRTSGDRRPAAASLDRWVEINPTRGQAGAFEPWCWF